MLHKINQRENELLGAIKENIGADTVRQGLNSIERLYRESKERAIHESHILLPFGGGKDSAWTLAYVRLMQLLLKAQLGITFHLHILIMVHPGVPDGVFDNIRSVFKALGLSHSEGDVSVVTSVRGGIPVQWANESIPQRIRDNFREEILFTGHLSQGNGRETFCNACNFGLMNVIASYVLSKKGQINFVITGDSNREILSYWRWVQRTASFFGLSTIDRNKKNGTEWGDIFGKLSEINNAYYNRLFGEQVLQDINMPFQDITKASIPLPKYFGIFSDTQYEFYEHKPFLEDFLGFNMKSDAFNFTESDCKNPMLMAHLRGLLADYEGRGYIKGIHEYLQLVKYLMNRKSYSQEMIEFALSNYQNDAQILHKKAEAEEYARKCFGITPVQLETMVGSPFTDLTARLGTFLRWRIPDMLSDKPVIKCYLDWIRTENVPEEIKNIKVSDSGIYSRFLIFLERNSIHEEKFYRVSQFITDISGLSPQTLRLLLNRRSVSNYSDEIDLSQATPELIILRKGDPHRLRISDKRGQANNLLTGR